MAPSPEAVLNTTEQPDLPFELALTGEDAPLVCDRLLRHLPGRRWVCGGRWGGQAVVAKIFLDRQRCKRHWLRECRGARVLRERGIPAPALIHAARLPGARAYVTVFEKVEGVSGATVWRGANDARSRGEFLERMVALLVQQHRAGLEQRDPHLDNVRLLDDRLMVLDPATIRASRKPLDTRRALDSLALQLVEFIGTEESELDAAYRHYCQAAGLDPETCRALYQRLYRRQRHYHVRKYLAKVFRSCTAFAAHRDGRSRWIYDREFDSRTLRRFLDDPDRYLESADLDLVKDGNSATVWRLHIDGKPLAVKRYNIKNPAHGLRRAVTRSRAARSWENAQRLRLLGIPTPRPVAFAEQRLGSLRGAAWLLTEWADGEPAVDYFVPGARSDIEQRDAARDLLDIIDRLGDEGLIHGDLKATNFLVGSEGAQVVDLDAMRVRSSSRDWRLGRDRDLERFRRNWTDSVWRSFFAHESGDPGP